MQMPFVDNLDNVMLMLSLSLRRVRDSLLVALLMLLLPLDGSL